MLKYNNVVIAVLAVLLITGIAEVINKNMKPIPVLTKQEANKQIAQCKKDGMNGAAIYDNQSAEKVITVVCVSPVTAK